MTDHTPVDEILCEVRELHQFILELVASPDTVRWHWPSYYLLYVDMDRMAWRIERAKSLFAEKPIFDDFASLERTRPSAVERAAWMNDTFADLGEKQRSMVDWLWEMSRNMMTVIQDKKLQQRIRAHFHPKSEWYQVFQSDYCPGRVSDDGKTLERTILRIDPDPPGRIHDLGKKKLYAYQYFDISTDEARILLAEAIGRIQQEHGQVARVMMEFFLAHCSVDKLVHPSSV